MCSTKHCRFYKHTSTQLWAWIERLFFDSDPIQANFYQINLWYAHTIIKIKWTVDDNAVESCNVCRRKSKKTCLNLIIPPLNLNWNVIQPTQNQNMVMNKTNPQWVWHERLAWWLDAYLNLSQPMSLPKWDTSPSTIYARSRKWNYKFLDTDITASYITRDKDNRLWLGHWWGNGNM